MENKKIVLIPITAQPPTFGIVMSIMSIAEQFDKIIICVLDNPIIIKTDVVIKMLSFIFKEPKYEIISHTCDFSTVHDVPTDELPYANLFGAISDRIYTNLVSKGIPCFLLPTCIGYDEVFHRSAFRKSQELELLRLKMSFLSYSKLKNVSTDTGGDEE